MFAPLAGYKTYIIGALTVIGAVLHMLVGDASIQDTLNLVVPAVLAMTVRHGISTAAK